MEMLSYAQAIAAFRWQDVLDELGWAGRASVNLAETIVDRHPPGRRALVWIGAAGEERSLTYGELAAASSRFANVLARQGVRKGDRVAVLMPRVPETFAVILGTFKAGAIFVPIFAGFGPDAVRYRLEHSGARLLCTHAAQRGQVPEGIAARVVCVGGGKVGDIDFASALAAERDEFPPVPCARDDAAAIIYTSGSTGPPKGGVIAVNLLAAVWPYLRYGLDLREDDDLFWPTGDPGWGYGLVCYLAAFAAGARVLCVQPNPDAQRCLEILAKHGVTNLATTPTLLRSVMALGAAAVEAVPNPVRVVSSCGEPLNGEVVEFFRRVWRATPMDHFGATEFALPIGNYNAIDMAVKPGSMGLPCPGHAMAVVDEAGRELPPEEVGLIGQKPDDDSRYWLSYWNDPAGARALAHGEWNCTGDLARRDAEGYFWFEGRANDIIKSAGYRIGPFEVESAILKHGAVAEAAVIGKPDALRGEIVKAYVVLKRGIAGSRALADEITELVRRDLGRHQYPREVEFVAELPKTQTGKIQRYILRAKSGSPAG
jgi:acetyl-CoA synthetase